METSLLIALISAASAAAIAVFASWRTTILQRQVTVTDLRNKRDLTQLESRLLRDEKDHDRKLSIDTAVKLYREQLLLSAEDLHERIDNIRNRGFLVYLRSDLHRSEVAVLSTLYRLAVYLAWVHTMESRIVQLRLAEATNTPGVVDSILRVSVTLSTDQYDCEDGYSPLMLWREEQRAIGGLMWAEDQQQRMMGFETFVERYERTFKRWLDSVAQDLHIQGIDQSERLEHLQSRLRTLTAELDIDGWLVNKN